jgi:hypothetical protein
MPGFPNPSKSTSIAQNKSILSLPPTVFPIRALSPKPPFTVSVFRTVKERRRGRELRGRELEETDEHILERSTFS